MEGLLDFSKPLDLKLLEQVVAAVHGENADERNMAQRVLMQFREHPEGWTKVDTILSSNVSEPTKFFALMVLEDVIRYRWKPLPEEQRDGIKNFLVNLVIKMSEDPATLRHNNVLNKLNLAIVQIVKQEWPQRWRNFIPEIVGASRTSESLCENNMRILKLLSEEIFDFSSGEMTQSRIRELKTSFNNEFSMVYQLCQFVLSNSGNRHLLTATLETLLRFLNWIPLGYVFETDLIHTLVSKFFPTPVFRKETVQCLTEIGSLSLGSIYDDHFIKLYINFMDRLREILPASIDLEMAYDQGSEEDKAFIHHLALFLTGFFKEHLSIVEKAGHQTELLEGLYTLCRIASVDNLEIFKICLDYWNIFAADVYKTASAYRRPGLMLSTSPAQDCPRKAVYEPIFAKVRLLLIENMAKPEEVLIVEDENGQIVRETTRDTDTIALYKQMRETLIYLCHLNYVDTENQMMEKMVNQVNGSEWSWHNLNTLCWAIGSISGAMSEEDEKRFIVWVIKHLLTLCEMKRGKENKAVVASNIMYIVRQYPRFLNSHWKFLKTVVNKLFEFMHEEHPGVQDMACDTFQKIAQRCRRKFVTVQPNEESASPFIHVLLSTLDETIQDLQPHQVQSFYESVGYMINAEVDNDAKATLIDRFFESRNREWTEIMKRAAESVDNLRDPAVCTKLISLIKVNSRAAYSLEHAYIRQLGRILMDLLNVYKAYSEFMSAHIAKGGPYASKSYEVKTMRAVRVEGLRLIETFVTQSDQPEVIYSSLVPPLMDAVLTDYKNALPDARDAAVLSLFAQIIDKIGSHMTAQVPAILDAVFECTLQMITQNFEDYPDHRIAFFRMLMSINAKCFQALFMIPTSHFKLVLDSIVWAVKHTERTIAETGLNILHELLRNVTRCSSEMQDMANAFFAEFYLPLLQDIFFVLTDTFHKPGFKMQAIILQEMVRLVESSVIKAPLWPQSTQPPPPNNQVFLRNHLVHLLSTSFSHLTPQQVHNFVEGLFNESQSIMQFKNHLRDFLVELKEFAAQDNSDLYLEERMLQVTQKQKEEEARLAAIPGMLPAVEGMND
eukprot:Rmarinus@m.18775